MTALCDRALRAHGPALLFEDPAGSYRGPNGATIPVLGNLFGTPERVAKAMGADPSNWQASLRDVGRLLSFLREPEPPKSEVPPMTAAAIAMNIRSGPPCSGTMVVIRVESRIPAKPASRFASTKFPILIMRTLIPASAAPIRLPPVATVWSPQRLSVSTSWSSSTIPSAQKNSAFRKSG